MPDTPVVRVVFTDANILINLIHLNRLDLLGALPGHEFIVPEPVVNELTIEEQRDVFDDAVGRGYLVTEVLTDIEELTDFAEFRLIMGDGEAACLAMAKKRGAIIATSDRRRRFVRAVREELGAGRLLNMIGLVLLAIQEGLLTVEEADHYKTVLEGHRFRMKLDSFGDLLGDDS